MGLEFFELLRVQKFFLLFFSVRFVKHVFFNDVTFWNV